MSQLRGPRKHRLDLSDLCWLLYIYTLVGQKRRLEGSRENSLRSPGQGLLFGLVEGVCTENRDNIFRILCNYLRDFAMKLIHVTSRLLCFVEWHAYDRKITIFM